jgi:hypothetical protein
METASTLTNHKCAHGPCGCNGGPAERYCSDPCEAHAQAPREDGTAGLAPGACGCGHPECSEPDKDARA